VAGRWFFPGTPVSSTDKTDHHDIAKILLKVVLYNITPNSHLFINIKKKKRIYLFTVKNHLDKRNPFIHSGVAILFSSCWFVHPSVCLTSLYMQHLHFKRDFLKTWKAVLLPYADSHIFMAGRLNHV